MGTSAQRTPPSGLGLRLPVTDLLLMFLNPSWRRTSYCSMTAPVHRLAAFCRICSDPKEGVKSIAMGGRPIAGPIQGVGGIKGAQSLRWHDSE